MFHVMFMTGLQLQELRDELDSRALSSKGLKSQLIARLTKALLLEEEADVIDKAVSLAPSLGVFILFFVLVVVVLVLSSSLNGT